MTESSFTLQELPSLRRKTEAVSRYLEQRLQSYFHALKPVLAPERILGKYGSGRSDIPGADKIVAQIAQDYEALRGKPLELPRGFDPERLKNCGPKLELHSHEYMHQAAGPDGAKPIRITAPLRWIVTYGSPITPFQILENSAGHAKADQDVVRQYVINALVMQAMLTRTPELVELFADLRIILKSEVLPEAGQLPFVTLTSQLPSFRPADDLILAATEFSGVPCFIELIDPQALTQSWHDPFKETVAKLLA